MSKALTPKQRRFVAEYLKDHNGTQAAIRAGYSEHSAGTMAQQLLAKTHIREATERAIQRVEERCIASAADVLTGLTNIAQSSMGDVVWKPCERTSSGEATIPGTPKPIYEMPLEVQRLIKAVEFDGKKRRIIFWDKDKAYALLMKYHRLTGEGPAAPSPAGGVAGFSAEGADGIAYEQLERIVVERITRIAAFRKSSNP